MTLTGATGFAGDIAFSCKGAPAGTTCTVNPNPATLGPSAKSVAVTVTITSPKSAALKPGLLRTLPFALAGVLGMVMALKRKPRQRFSMLMAVCMVISLCGCGARVAAPPPTDANITVTGTAANGVTSTIDLSLTLT